MKLKDITPIEVSIKTVKPEIVKLVHQFVFESDKGKYNRKNLKEFQGFPWKPESPEFEAKLTQVKKDFSQSQLNQIAHFFQIEVDDEESVVAKEILTLLCDLEKLKLTFGEISEDEDVLGDEEELNFSVKNQEENVKEKNGKKHELIEEKSIQHQEVQTSKLPITSQKETSYNLPQVGKMQYQQNVENKEKGNNYVRDSDIVVFSVEDKMNWKNWLTYFEECCNDEKRDEVWKIRNVQRFLKGRALTLYINNNLNIRHWEELVELFHEEFTTSAKVSFSDFSDITFKVGDDVVDYYHKKLQVGRNLGLEPSLLLEGLTEGLPQKLKHLVVANSPKTTAEWRDIVHKLNKLQIAEESHNRIAKTPMPYKNNPQYFYQGRSQRYPSEHNPNLRPWTYSTSWANNPRPFSVPNEQGGQRGPRPYNNYPNVRPPYRSENTNKTYSRPQLKPASHFTQDLPPSPCKFCSQKGIVNAYHWGQNCINRPGYNNNPEQNLVRKENDTNESQQM